MAKLEQGILGPFRGKVGTVVGYLWRGRQVVRAYRREINYPNTERQQAERDWFVGMVRFAATARQALLLGLRERAVQWQMTEGNAFVKMNKGWFCLTPAPSPNGEGSGIHVDYERIALSCGPVAPVAGGAWDVDEQQVLTCRWERRTPLPRCKSNDNVHVYIYNSRTREGLLAAPARRGGGVLSVALPDGWATVDLHCYLFATDVDGRASASVYALRAERTEPASLERIDVEEDSHATRVDAVKTIEPTKTMKWNTSSRTGSGCATTSATCRAS